MQVNIKDSIEFRFATITIYLPGPYLGHNMWEERKSLRVKWWETNCDIMTTQHTNSPSSRLHPPPLCSLYEFFIVHWLSWGNKTERELYLMIHLITRWLTQQSFVVVMYLYLFKYSFVFVAGDPDIVLPSLVTTTRRGRRHWPSHTNTHLCCFKLLPR